MDTRGVFLQRITTDSRVQEAGPITRQRRITNRCVVEPSGVTEKSGPADRSVVDSVGVAIESLKTQRCVAAASRKIEERIFAFCGVLIRITAIRCRTNSLGVGSK